MACDGAQNAPPEDRAGVIVVRGQITKVFSLKLDRKPPRHQVFLMQIEAVEATVGDVTVALTPDLLICMQWGEHGSPRRPIPGLKAGEPVRARGLYVCAEEAYWAPDDCEHPVLHFTHHPVGWVEYRGVRYGDDVLPSRADRWAMQQARRSVAHAASHLAPPLLRRSAAARPPAVPAASPADPPAPPV